MTQKAIVDLPEKKDCSPPSQKDTIEYLSILGLIVEMMNNRGITDAALAGWIYDSTGGYTTAWLPFAGLAGLAIPAILTAKRPVKRKKI